MTTYKLKVVVVPAVRSAHYYCISRDDFLISPTAFFVSSLPHVDHSCSTGTVSHISHKKAFLRLCCSSTTYPVQPAVLHSKQYAYYRPTRTTRVAAPARYSRANTHPANQQPFLYTAPSENAVLVSYYTTYQFENRAAETVRVIIILL